MTRDDYLTILEPGHAQTRVLGSRFLGSALPVLTSDDVEQCLDVERKRHYDATHWCYAFRLGAFPSVTEFSTDAGEPKGTAGVPILREIQGRDLTGALVVVTRYFGGTKLGTGNLARAYAECASQALDNATTVRKYVTRKLRIACPYDLQSIVYRLAQKHEAEIVLLPSLDRAEFEIVVRASATDQLAAELTDESRGSVTVKRDPPL